MSPLQDRLVPGYRIARGHTSHGKRKARNWAGRGGSNCHEPKARAKGKGLSLDLNSPVKMQYFAVEGHFQQTVHYLFAVPLDLDR